MLKTYMNYWLVKSEPDEYSWQDLVKDKKTVWTGIRNYAARGHLKNMQVGDRVFFYHSNVGKDIVGIAEVVKTAYPDPTSGDDDRWLSVDLVPVESLKRAVTLEEIKVNKDLVDMALVRISRLSVQPVTESEFKKILELASNSH